MRTNIPLTPVCGVLLWLCLLVTGVAAAQGLPGTVSGDAKRSDSGAANEAPPLRASLDEVINTLENDERRSALLGDLKALRQSVAARADAAEPPEQRGGLLGALADSLDELGSQARSGHSTLDIWTGRTRGALADTMALFASMDRKDLLAYLVEAGGLLAIWAGLLAALAAMTRTLFKRRDWPLVLPPEPRPWMLAAHFLRKVLPWALVFVVLLITLRGLGIQVSTRAVALVVAYIGLCGQALATVFEVLIASFTRGHRRVAVAMLHRSARTRLFVIGALVAFGEAVDSEGLTQLLGIALSGWLSVLSNVAAGALTGLLVIRVRRPVKHLLGNRPYNQRRGGGVGQDLLSRFAGVWYVPALLVIIASVGVTLFSAGSVEGAFTDAMLCAVLLVIALVLTGMLRRQSDKTAFRPRGTQQYVTRLLRFGYTVAQFLVWTVYGELSLRVWGLSLFGIGGQGAISARIGQALLGLGLTVLLAWLAWIFTDTAIERALRSSTRRRGRRFNSVRAQTITPMLRNVAFFTIVVIAAIAGLANLGVNVTPLLAGAGVIGIAIGFGAQTLVQDLITGMFIVIEDSLSVGDFVDINNYMGTVEGLSLRTVKLRDIDGIVHIITFSRIDSIHNMSREFGIALMKIRIPADMPIDDAIALMQETDQELRRDPRMNHLVRSSLEIQGIHGFEEGCPILRMRLRTAPEYQWEVSRTFNLLLKRRMEAGDFELGAPRLSISVSGAGGRYFAGPNASQSASGSDAAPPGDADPAAPGGEADPRGAAPDST